MRFQESDRVSYEKNPLVEVICQARFNRLLRIDSEVPAAFQQSLIDDYPKVVETNSFAAAIPPQLAQIVRLDASVASQRAFDFVSADDEWSVSITSQFVALTTKNYRRWEDFRGRLTKIFDAFTAVYQVTTFTRLGLRYQDLIQRSKLGLDGQRWSTLLNPKLVGELAEDGFEADAKHIAKELVFGLDFDDASVRLYHGLARNQNADESCYLIDSDFFREQPTERGDAIPILDRFNREAGKLFRWAISTPFMPRWIPSPSLDRSAPAAGTKLGLAGTSSYDEVVARFVQRLWQLLAGTLTTGSIALERKVLPTLSPMPALSSESPEEKRRLDAARAEWARAFSARVDTMRTMLNDTSVVDTPTPAIPGDE